MKKIKDGDLRWYEQFTAKCDFCGAIWRMTEVDAAEARLGLNGDVSYVGPGELSTHCHCCGMLMLIARLPNEAHKIKAEDTPA